MFTRKVATENKISQLSVCNIFKKHRFYLYKRSSIARRILNHYVLVSGGGVRVSDVTGGYDVTWEGETGSSSLPIN